MLLKHTSKTPGSTIACTVLYNRSPHNLFCKLNFKFSAPRLHVPKITETKSLQLQLYSEWSVRELSFAVRTYFVWGLWFSQRLASRILVKSTTKNPGHRSLASWLMDMSVQNLRFGRLFNKKNDMKYFKNLIIVQMWATRIHYLLTFDVNLIKCCWIMLMAMSNSEKWLSHTKSGIFF